MINFLITHIVSQIRTKAKNICDGENYSGFIWLEQKVIDGNRSYDRVDERYIYEHDEVMPISWYMLKPKTVLEIYKSIKENNIYLKRKEGEYYVKSKPYELTE